MSLEMKRELGSLWLFLASELLLSHTAIENAAYIA